MLSGLDGFHREGEAPPCLSCSRRTQCQPADTAVADRNLRNSHELPPFTMPRTRHHKCGTQSPVAPRTSLRVTARPPDRRRARAASVALVLEVEGKRKNYRWERGSVSDGRLDVRPVAVQHCGRSLLATIPEPVIEERPDGARVPAMQPQVDLGGQPGPDLPGVGDPLVVLRLTCSTLPVSGFRRT